MLTTVFYSFFTKRAETAETKKNHFLHFSCESDIVRPLQATSCGISHTFANLFLYKVLLIQTTYNWWDSQKGGLKFVRNYNSKSAKCFSMFTKWSSFKNLVFIKKRASNSSESRFRPLQKCLILSSAWVVFVMSHFSPSWRSGLESHKFQLCISAYYGCTWTWIHG